MLRYLIPAILALATALNAAERPAPSNPARTAAAAWCEEDAAAALAAGQPEIAATGQADAKTLRSTHGSPLLAPGSSLLPPIPGDVKANPLVGDFIKRVETLLRENKTFAKGPEGGAVRDATGWAFPTRADQLLILTQAFCHPQSPLAGDPRLVAPILRRVASISEYLVPDSKSLGDFGFCDTFADAWLILRTTRPDILPPGLSARTEASLKTNADYIVKKWGPTFADPSVHYGVVNMDVRRLLALAATERLFPDPERRALVASGVRFLSHSVLPDGATHYAERQNEAFSYHIAAVRGLLRIAQLTDSAEALALVRAMRWYYPLSVEPGGVAEWSTAASWHHYWNTISGSDGALILAALTDCTHNQRIALANPPRGDLWLASFFRPDLALAPAPDRYFVYDRNIQGPRGRFGNWSFVGTARNFGYTPGDIARGKSSYVGAMLTTGSSGNWPLDAALQDVGTAVKLSAGPLPEGEMPWLKELACLTSVESTTTTVGDRCAALGADALLAPYAKKATPWRQRQAWIFTPERLLGLVTITADADTAAREVLGTLMLVGGRGHWGKKHELKTLAPGRYSYGGLAVTFRARDFATITGQPTDVMSGSITHGTDTPGKSMRLLLQNPTTTPNQPTSYTKGDSRFYVVEIHPLATAPAQRVAHSRDGGLLTLALQDGTGTYQLAYNPSAQAAPWTRIARSETSVIHRSGEAFRPAWIEPEAIAAPSLPVPKSELSVPAGELLLIEQPALAR